MPEAARVMPSRSWTRSRKEDEKKQAEKELQKLHDDHVARIDEIVKAKEAEIMEV
jgi:ribosome recycling factor